MEKQFIPFVLALKLKELGFNEECLAHYQNDDEPFLSLDKSKKHDSYSGQICLAPLWQQAFDWFEEKHNLFVEYMFDDMRWEARVGEFCIPDFYPDDFAHAIPESKGYEQAKKDKQLIKLKALETLIFHINKK